MDSSTSRRRARLADRRRQVAGVLAVTLAVVAVAGIERVIRTGADEDSLPFDVEPRSAYASESSFVPHDVEARPGERVRFVNQDQVSHTFTDDEGLFDSGSVRPGGTFEFEYVTSGEFSFHCEIHATMRGTISIRS